MTDFEISLKGLKNIREKIGAKLTNYTFKGANLPPMNTLIDKELYEGIEASLDEIETQDGLFVREGQQVVIYIKDHTYKGRESVMQNPHNGNKVHLYECQKIIEMKMAGRFKRYIITTRKDNIYKIDDKRGKDIKVKLYPCQHCLKVLNYKGFRTRFFYSVKKFLDTFDLEEFFGTYSTFFTTKPDHSDITAPYSGYVKNWDSISRARRKSDGWICNDCGVNLSHKQYQKHLHVHHINGVKPDVGDENLRCLCVVCHANQPNHSHMKPQAREYESLISRLRREQRLD